MVNEAATKEVSMSGERPSGLAAPDPADWVDRHGDYLFRYALARVRDRSLAEDLVQEALLAALQSLGAYAGRSAERTWLTGILKHNILDHFRRASRQTALDESDEARLEHEELFQREGEWAGHWDRARGPADWRATPADLFERGEFRDALARCLAGLPARAASAFTLREMEGLSGEEVCAALGISASNLWVTLHRARMHLRHCVESNWFRRPRS